MVMDHQCCEESLGLMNGLINLDQPDLCDMRRLDSCWAVDNLPELCFENLSGSVIM